MRIQRKFTVSNVCLSKIKVPRDIAREQDAGTHRIAVYSLRKFGQKRPLMVDAHFRLLGDYYYYFAMKELNFPKVEIVKFSRPTPQLVAAVYHVIMDYSDTCEHFEKLNAAFAALTDLYSKKA